MFKPLLALTALLCSTALAAPGDYPLPLNLAQVPMPRVYNDSGKLAPLTLSKPQRDLLSRNGFVVSPTRTLQFYELYESGRYADLPVFVTADSALHVYHLVFDKMLRDLEREKLYPALKRMNTLLVTGAEKQAAAAKGTSLEKDANTVLAYLALAQKLADPQAKVPASVNTRVMAEKALIDAHAGVQKSALFGFDEDYSQYTVRGHYTRGEALKNYFRGMMWYGRINFRLKDSSETRMALLLTRLLAASPEAQKLWGTVYDPTSFIVGVSDDLNYRQYAAIAEGVYGKGIPLAALSSADRLEDFRDAARALPDPKINSLVLDVRVDVDKKASSKGWRTMGQRFVLDGLIFENLLYRTVGTDQKPRLLPKGLDVFAALGSPEAYSILKGMGETGYANYDAQMGKLRTSLAQLSSADWNTTLYAGWLDTLRALVQPRGKAYPAFMRTQAWARKDLQAALGSYTELKHDTILYAKQVMAEMGAGDEPTPPQGYVEPNPEVYSRLKALSRKSIDGLKRYNILTEKTANSLRSLEEMAGFLERVSRDQMAGKALSRDDYERIHYFGGWLEELTLASTDTTSGEGSPTFSEDQRAAVVADIATDPNGRALEQGTGFISEVLAVVPDGKGKLQIARGGTYSYYEFAVPSSGRLTNAAWHAMLDSNKAPAPPEWTKLFTAK